MTLEIYNSLSKKKEEFNPIDKNLVRMYVCGMTVYSDAHIGHARTYFAFDVIRRYLKYKGYDVKYVQNITDVDDKIIDAANEKGVDPLDYSRRFADRCLEDLDKLGIQRADIYPRASETIPDMIDMINEIKCNGFGYETDGDVYFSVEKFDEYGKLSGQKVDEMKSSGRIEPGEKKKSPIDFALWKSSKPNEPSWDSPWGKGRPGWHIECSAMSAKYLDLPFDIHGGGMDLRFPHHENEIAQAEAAYGVEFAKYWMHVGLLTVDGEKMSKSLGNIVNIKDLLKNWDAEVIRFFFAKAHYRSPPDFSEKALENARKGLHRIRRVKERLEDFSLEKGEIKLDKSIFEKEDSKFLDAVNVLKKDFENAMDDDFNTPLVVSVIFDFVNKTNAYFDNVDNPNRALCKYAIDTLSSVGLIITLFQDKDPKVSDFDDETKSKIKELVEKYGLKSDSDDIGFLIDLLLKIREKARDDRNWDKADDIRNDLDRLGFEIQDTEKGPIWRKK